MGCAYSDREGKCELNTGFCIMPVDKKGYCKVEKDPNPNCEDYEEL